MGEMIDFNQKKKDWLNEADILREKANKLFAELNKWDEEHPDTEKVSSEELKAQDIKLKEFLETAKKSEELYKKANGRTREVSSKEEMYVNDITNMLIEILE